MIFWILIGFAAVTGLTQLFAFAWIACAEAEVISKLRDDWKQSRSVHAKVKAIFAFVGVVFGLVIMILLALASAPDAGR